MKEKRNMMIARLFGLSCIMSCLGWTASANAETPAESEVRQAMIDVVSAAARLDADGIVARLDPGPARRYYVQGQSFNYADLAVFLSDSFADMTSQKVIWLESSAQELTPDTVLWTSSGRNPVVEKSGREIEYLLAETWLWNKAGEGWRAIHYHESFLEMPSKAKRARVESALTAFASTFKPESKDPQSVLPALEEFVRANADVKGSAFGFAPREGAKLSAPYVYRKGDTFVRKLELADSDYTQSGWYSGPAGGGKPVWSEPYFDTYGAETMMITYGIPIFDPQGVLVGVLTADVVLY